MRISSQQIYETLLAGIHHQWQANAEASEQGSTGRRFNRPSQDAVAYKTSLDMRHIQSGIDSSLGAIQVAKLRLGMSENALAPMLPILHRAQALAVQLGSATNSAAERKQAAVEISILRDQLVTLTNSRINGVPLFAGTATDVDPITLDANGNAVYQGNAQERLVAITSTQTIGSNIRADHTAFTQMFASVKSLEDSLAINDVNGIMSALDQLNLASDAMVELTAEVGGRMNTLNIREQAFLDLKAQTEIGLGKHEAVDMAEVASRLSQSQIALQATYAQISSFQKLSLVNFLR
ncbi:MAG: hypothetical protein ACE5DY_05685 [Mariprofundaceae bacterium]